MNDTDARGVNSLKRFSPWKLDVVASTVGVPPNTDDTPSFVWRSTRARRRSLVNRPPAETDSAGVMSKVASPKNE